MNGIWLWIKEFVIRLSQDSPEFFKKLRWVCLIVFILLTGIYLVNQVYPFGLEKVIIGTITWNSIIINIATGLGFVFGFTYLPTKDKPVIPSKSNDQKQENV